MGIQTSISISFGKGRGGWRVRGKEKFKKEQKWNESEALRNTTHEVLKGGSASAFSLFSFVIFFVRLNVEVEGGGGIALLFRFDRFSQTGVSLLSLLSFV